MKKFNYYLISKYRKEIMGFSIIQILLHHIFEDIISLGNPELLYFKTANILFNFFSSFGVDIFLFLSAIGLFFSIKRDNSLINFYKKRIFRVFVPYLFLASIFWIYYDIIIHKLSFKYVIYDLFWISLLKDGVITFWYIYAILLLYLTFPIINYFINSDKKKSLKRMILLISITYIFNMLILFANHKLYGNLILFLSRIPIFILGIYIAPKVYGKDELTKKEIFELSIFSGIAFIIKIILIIKPMVKLGGTINLFATSISSLLIIYLLCMIFENFYINRTKKLLTFTGKITLYIYIISISLRKIMRYYWGFNIIYEIIMISISITLAYIFDKIYDKIRKNNKEGV